MNTLLKKFFGSLIILGVLIPSVASAQSGASLWKLVSNNLLPVTSTWNLKIPALGGSGTKCLHTDNAGLISTAAADCGSGSGGITSINADTTAAQLLVTGTSGSDFAITDSGTGTHTFNLPTASASVRGALSSTDWSTFNNKQNSLTVSNGLTLTGSALKLGGVLTESTNINGISGGFNLLVSGEQFTAAATDTMFIKTPGVSGGGATNGTFLKLVNATTGEVEFDTAGGGTVTSVDVSGGTTGLTYSGGPITTSGTITMAGTLGVANGGTNATSFTGRALVVAGSGGTSLGSLALGTANQMLGMNSGASQNEYKTLAVGTSGTDFAIAHSAGTVTFNLPDAGAAARGAVTTGTQTFAGAKTFSSAPTFSTMTAGSVLFAATAGLLSQDNASFFYDNTNDILKLGGGTPTYTLGTNTLATFTKNANTFVTFNLQNLSNGTTASTDLIINNDAATDTTNFLDIGISSSLNTDPLYTIAGAGQAYIWNTSEALAIGTAGAFPLKFFTGGTLAANESARITSTGIWQIGTTTPTQGRVNIAALSTTAPALNLRGAASMNGEVFNVENSSGTDQFQIYQTSTGTYLAFGSAVNNPSQSQPARIRSDMNGVSAVAFSNSTANTLAAAAYTMSTSAGSIGKIQLNSATNATYGGNSSLNLINVNNAPLTLGTNDTVRVAITGAGSVNIGSVSLASGTNALSVTGTQSSSSATQVGSLFSITGAGSDSNSHTGVRIEYLAGFTGSGATRGFIGYNQNAGTGTNMALSSAATSPLGNIGTTGLADATTTGTNVGQWGVGENGNVNYGAGGRATIAKNSATNIGIAGFALNTGTSPIQVAGYFGLQNSTPTYTSAALIADNGSQTSPIFLGRDNGSVVLNLIDGGKMFLGGSTTPTATLHLAAGTATASTAPLKFTSGALNTTAVAGQIEYNNSFYQTNNAANRYALGGVLADYFTDTTVGGSEADIYTITTIANTLATNGEKLTASYSGNFVTVGTELTQLKAYFGGTAIWDSTGVAPTTGTTSWNVKVELIRVSSTVVRYSVSLTTTGASGFVYQTTGELTGLTLSGTNVLKITGTSSGVGSGSGDIVGKMGTVEWKGAANL